MSDVSIKIDIKGTRIAGQARYKNSEYILRFHPLAVENYYEHMVSTTIPHEVAHIVCMKNPALGCNHDAGWKKVCRILGGSAERTHDMNLGEPKQKDSYIYRTDVGTEVDIGLIRHNKLLRGKVDYYMLNGKERITKENFVKSVKKY